MIAMNETQARNPVLLIHGIFDTTTIFKAMSAHLKQDGWEVHSFNLYPNYGLGSIEDLANQIVEYVDKNFAPNQPFDLIGFSMGGIVSRYYVQKLGGLNRVQRLITISAPHNGTLTAHFYPTTAAEQMRRDSPLLKDLNDNLGSLDRINFTSIWTQFDIMIIPANSSHLPIGEEIILDVWLHAWMVREQKCILAVEKALATPLKSV